MTPVLCDQPDPPSIQVPDHRLIRLIGQGSYGEVWLAQNVFEIYRAVKVVYRKTFEDQRPYDREFAAIKRVESLSRSHDGFVDILQAGRNDDAGYFYYVMELGDDQTDTDQVRPQDYRAKTLGSELKRRGRLAATECIQIGVSLSATLQYLHENGLVHRDVKPSNIIYVKGVPKLADIGLVAGVGAAHSFVGTEGFIPPEGPGTAKADIYSLGKVLYEINTGRDRIDFPALPTELLGLPEGKDLLEINEIVLRACAIPAERRYKSAAELNADLVLLQSGRSIHRLRSLERRMAILNRVGLVSVLVAIFGAGVFYQISQNRKRASDERQRQAGSFVAYGSRATGDGDILGSLPWFVEALRIDQSDKDREETDRVRIAATLDQSPRLVQMWFQKMPVNEVHFRPYSHQILSTGYGRETQIFDITTGLEINSPLPLEKGLTAVFNREGTRILTGGGDNKVRIFDADHPSRGSQVEFVHDAPVLSARFDNACRRVAVAAGTNAYIWDADTGAALATLSFHNGKVTDAEFSPDGELLATASQDNSVALWNTKTWKRTRMNVFAHPSWVFRACFSPDGKYLATACFDSAARIWDIETGREIFHPVVHDDGIHSVEFSPDGRYLVTAGYDDMVRVWEVRTGRLVGAPLRHSAKVMHASFSPDGRAIVTGCWDGTIRVWQWDNSLAFPPPVSLAYSGSGKMFASFSGSTITSHRPDKADQFVTNSFAIQTLLVNEAGDLGVALGFPNKGIQAQLLNLSLGSSVGNPFHLTSDSARPVLSRSGSLLAGLDKFSVSIWDTRKGERIFTPPTDGTPVMSVDFSPSETRLLFATETNAQVWDFPGRRPVTPYLSNQASLSHAEFSPDGKLFATSYWDVDLNAEYARVWDAVTGLPASPPLNHRDGVLFVSFSPDGQKVVTASEDFTAAVWDIKTGRQVVPPLRHKNQVWEARFSPDGRWIITLCRNSELRIWDAASGDPITPPILQPRPTGHGRFVNDQKQIMTQRLDGETRVWDLRRDTRSATELAGIAQLLSGQQYFSPRLSTVQNSDTLKQLWEKLRPTYSSGLLPNPAH